MPSTNAIWILTNQPLNTTAPYAIHVNPARMNFIAQWQAGTNTSTNTPSCLKSYMFPSKAAAVVVKNDMLTYEGIHAYVQKITVYSP